MANVRKKGFTLVELIVVIAIIGVLAAILIPSMMGYIKKSRRTSDIQGAKSIFDSITAVLADDEDVVNSFTANNSVSYNVSTKKGDATVNYSFVVVCTKKGSGENLFQWNGASAEAEKFLKALDAISDSKKARIKYAKTESGAELNRWFIGYRSTDPWNIEVWAGNSSVPVYRLWPDTDPDYS